MYNDFNYEWFKHLEHARDNYLEVLRRKKDASAIDVEIYRQELAQRHHNSRVDTYLIQKYDTLLTPQQKEDLLAKVEEFRSDIHNLMNEL